MADDVVPAGERPGLDRRHRPVEVGLGFADKHHLTVVVPQAPAPEEGAEAGHRVAGQPLGLLVGVAVEPGVVGGGVGAEAVTDRFDQRRALPGGGTVHRLPGGGVHGEDVHAVDQHPGHPVGGGLPGDGGRGGLLLVGHRDGVAVVLAEEHGRGAPHAGEVEPAVEVGLRGAAVAEVGDRHHVPSGEAGGIGVAHRMREMAGDGDGDRHHPVAVDVPVHVGEPAPVGEDHLERHPPGDLDGVLPVGGVDEVIRAGARRRTPPGSPRGPPAWRRCPAAPGAGPPAPGGRTPGSGASAGGGRPAPRRSGRAGRRRPTRRGEHLES